MMEYYVIDKWEECVNGLNEYDCMGSNLNSVGVTLWSDGSISKPVEGSYSYTGTFWWANAKHIQTLNDDLLYSDYRIDRELWIGSNPNSNPGTLYQPHECNLYMDLYSEKDYVK